MTPKKYSLVSMIVCALMVLWGVAALYSYQHYQQLVQQQVETDSERLKTLLSNSKARLDRRFPDGDMKTVERELMLLSQHESVALSVLVDNEGVIRFSSSYIVLNQSVSGPLQILDQTVFSQVQLDQVARIAVSRDQKAIFAYYPIDFGDDAKAVDDKTLGVLCVKWDLAPALKNIQQRITTEMIFISILLLLALLTMTAIYYFHFLKPLRKLNKRALEIVREGEPLDYEVAGTKALRDLVVNLNRIQHTQKKAQSHSQRWQFVLESAGDCVLDWDIASNECYFSDGFGKLLGLDDRDCLDWNRWKQCIDEDWDIVDRKLKRHLQGLSDICQVEYSVELSSGKRRMIVMRGKVVERGPEGEPLRMVSSHRDITARRQMEDALRRSEERYRKLFELAQEGIWQIDAQGQTLLVNDSMAIMLGYQMHELQGRPVWEFMSESSRTAIQDKLNRKGLGAETQQEYELKSKSGLVVYTTMHWSPVYDMDDSFDGMIAGVMDISERRRAEERIKQQALYDELTSLPNRRMLNEKLSQEQARALRHGHKGALLFIDLDHFKNVNDSLGHPVGDSLLITIAGRLNQVLRTEDTLARLGGDEFVVLLPELHDNPSKAASLARNVALKIQDCMSDVLEVHGYKLNVGCSIGIALYPLDQDSIHDIVKQADAAMYRAKEEGRSAICLFSKEMHQQIEANLRLQMLLPGALEEEQFVLYFQPQFNQLSQLIGAEVLLRWEEPEQGFVRPELFIRAAEESGQIVPLGDWVLRKACLQLNEWQRLGMPATFERLAINISARQFTQDNFPYRVKAFVEEAGLQPQDIELEITESMLLSKMELVIEKMHLLHDMGFHIALDDFGTGYSSLSYLHTLPLDKLKIDQAFIRDIDVDKGDRAIVETIITMAKLMELDVIAEGVEEESQLRYLLSKGCSKFQGYFFAKPMPASLFAASWIAPESKSSAAKKQSQ